MADWLDDPETTLRPPVSRADAERRNRLIERAIQLKLEIETDIRTIRYWNEHLRRPSEPEIDLDPDGTLAKALQYLNRLIGNAVQ